MLLDWKEKGVQRLAVGILVLTCWAGQLVAFHDQLVPVAREDRPTRIARRMDFRPEMIAKFRQLYTEQLNRQRVHEARATAPRTWHSG